MSPKDCGTTEMRDFFMLRAINFRCVILCTIFLNVQFTTNFAEAQFFNGPVVTGAGGTGRASVDPLEGIFLNPASLSQLQTYALGFYWTDTNNNSQANNRDLSFIIADSSPEKLLPAGFSYTKRRITRRGASPIDQKDLYLAIADHVVSRLSMGIGFRRSLSDIDGQDINQNNLIVGFLFTPTENLGFGLVMYDILAAKSDVPEIIQLNRTLGAGATYIMLEMLRLRLDWTLQIENNSGSDGKYMMGFESVIHDFLTVRSGLQIDDQNKQNFFSLGFSFTGPRLVVDYAVQKEIAPSDGGWRHLVDLRLRF